MQTCTVLHNVIWMMTVMLAYAFSGLQTSGACKMAPNEVNYVLHMLCCQIQSFTHAKKKKKNTWLK